METGRGVSIPRRQLHSDDKVDSPNLRDFLRIKEDDNNNYIAGQTLGSALRSEKRGAAPERFQSNRTLLDIIREEPAGGKNCKDNKKSWRHFKEKLRLHRQGSGSSWTSFVPLPTSDVPINQNNSSRMMSRRDSIRMNMPISDGSSNTVVELTAGTGLPRTRSAILQRNASRAIERGSRRYDNYNETDDADEESEEEGVGETAEEEEDAEATAEGGDGGVGENQPVRMSLMALLAETDRQMGIDGSTYMMEDDEDEEEEEEEEKRGAGDYNNCCVCMVRHKGAAFIPCGHTFCRLCSRELWVQRGNCPLCNNFILEILDIF